MTKLIQKFARDDKGATAIEYGIIAALICVALVVGATALGGQLNTVFNALKTTIAG
jgi:pilus assembly protein Flp/PilA